MAHQVELKTACMDDLDVYAFRDSASGRLRVTGVAIDGELAVPTLSFWRSMFGAVGLSSQVGTQFDEYTWFLRMRNAHPYLVFRYAKVTDRHGNAMLMGEPRDMHAAIEELEETRTSHGTADWEDLVAERLAQHWQAVTPDAGEGLMPAPEGSIRPSLN